MDLNPIAVRPTAIVRVLTAGICFLALAHVISSLTRHVGGYPSVFGLVPLFDLNTEQSIPTYFSASLHLCASLLLLIVTRIRKQVGAPFVRQWAVLAAGFLFMAFDEAAGLHELMGRPMQALLGHRATGVFHFAWVLPAMLITLFFAVWFLKFLRHLPPSTRMLMIAAGTLFIGGAVGVELFEGRHAALHGSYNLTFDMFVLAEETLEMIGVTVFIYALLRYLEAQYGEVRFRLGKSAEDTLAAT